MLLLPTAIYLFHIPYIIYFLCHKQTKDRFLCIKLSHLVTRGTLVSYVIFLALVSIIASLLALLLGYCGNRIRYHCPVHRGQLRWWHEKHRLKLWLRHHKRLLQYQLLWRYEVLLLGVESRYCLLKGLPVCLRLRWWCQVPHRQLRWWS